MFDLRLEMMGEEEGEDVGRITKWLEASTIEDFEGEIKQQIARVVPATPPRQPLLQELHDEISPTDTSFSCESIFDIPGKYHAPSSPCPRRPFRDDVSAASSC